MTPISRIHHALSAGGLNPGSRIERRNIRNKYKTSHIFEEISTLNFRVPNIWNFSPQNQEKIVIFLRGSHEKLVTRFFPSQVGKVSDVTVGRLPMFDRPDEDTRCCKT